MLFILRMLASEDKEKKKVSTQMEKLRCNRPLFYACNRAILYIMRKTGEGVRFCLFLRKYLIQPSMVHSSDKMALY